MSEHEGQRYDPIAAVNLLPAWEADARAAEAAFWEAEQGVGEVPPYTVSTDPADNSFVVLGGETDGQEGRARIAGDCRRRFLQQVETGVDGFAGLRVPWPGSAAGGAGGQQ